MEHLETVICWASWPAVSYTGLKEALSAAVGGVWGGLKQDIAQRGSYEVEATDMLVVAILVDSGYC